MPPGSLHVFPVGKVLHVADDVLIFPGSTKPSVVNLWEIVRVPVGATFPYILSKVCTLAWMRDGLGTANFRVDIVDVTNNTLIRQSQTYSYSFPNRLRSALVVIRLLNVVFPQPGMYLVEFYCDNQFLDDQPIQVIF